jgi:DNA-binding response OmpR family regulator
LPVILLTGHMSKETNEEGLKAGAIDYIIKPINIDDLIVKLQEAVALYS